MWLPRPPGVQRSTRPTHGRVLTASRRFFSHNRLSCAVAGLAECALCTAGRLRGSINAANVFERTSYYTASQMKAYKSLEAYNYFVCGWVNDLAVESLGPCQGPHILTLRTTGRDS
ncbi:hypothetical protein SKAU_G00040670 [Synaphobranchus kaupii]|uniref:Uncharacterized protein n=1 Tax=Synaphobranchus kaupii TaxID=118154 RepID=A0A9Q1J8T6_SYNKA|nr:hypothetical protein SKAU_G00040670 [Synaphobranchus kaupii]